MSGHSKWSSIKHKKGRADAKRGNMFSKLSKLVMLAARSGGGDVDTNLKLRYAVDKSRAAGMPKENIERAIAKATGKLEGVDYLELTYEAYGHGGVAVVIDLITDNRNRTSSEIRKLLEKRGGRMATPGATAHLFEKKGLIAIPMSAIGEDELMELALEAGAEDIQSGDDSYEITTTVADFETVRKALAERGLELEGAEICRLPLATIKVDEKQATKLLALVAALEEHDDVDSVSCNAELPEELPETSE